MEKRSELIRKLLYEWLVQFQPQMDAANWVQIVPADEWMISEERWQTEALDLTRVLEAEFRISIPLQPAVVEPFRQRPLGEFAAYLEGFIAGQTKGKARYEAPDHFNARWTEAQGPVGGLYPVWFGTNREPNDARDSAKGFSNKRSSTTHYGQCLVNVPESHKIGSIGSGVLRRLLTGVDDRLTVEQIAMFDAAQLWRSVQEAINAAPSRHRHAVFFIHGYNTSFEEAALRAAQIGVDLSIEAMAFFSWPSKGALLGYLADGSAIEASEFAIFDFLATFAEQVEADAIHVIAHSMGNRGLLRVVNRIVESARLKIRKPFKQIVLAAADVDVDTFKASANAYGEVAERTTLYTSARDLALRTSGMLADFPRVGFWPPIFVFPNMQTISVTKLDLTGIGHGYIADARPVLSDLHQLLFTGLPAADRFGTELQHNDLGEPYWSIRA